MGSAGREKGSQVLHGEVGAAPELDVGAGAVAGRPQAAALDPIAPELAVLEPGGSHRGGDTPQGLAGAVRLERRIGGVVDYGGESQQQQVHFTAPYDPGAMVGVLRERVPHPSR